VKRLVDEGLQPLDRLGLRRSEVLGDDSRPDSCPCSRKMQSNKAHHIPYRAEYFDRARERNDFNALERSVSCDDSLVVAIFHIEFFQNDAVRPIPLTAPPA